LSIQKKERALVIVGMYNNGHSLQEIGDKFKVSRQRVQQILIECGTPRRINRGERARISIPKLTDMPDYLESVISSCNERIKDYQSRLHRELIRNAMLKKYYKQKLLRITGGLE